MGKGESYLENPKRNLLKCSPKEQAKENAKTPGKCRCAQQCAVAAVHVQTLLFSFFLSFHWIGCVWVMLPFISAQRLEGSVGDAAQMPPGEKTFVGQEPV